MTEELSQGAGAEVAREGASTEKPVAEGAMAEVEALRKELEAERQRKEKDISSLRSSLDKRHNEEMKAMEDRLATIQATMDEGMQRSLGEQEYQELQSRHGQNLNPEQVKVWRTGSVYTYGLARGLPHEELAKLAQDRNLTPYNLESRLDQLETRLEARKAREELEQLTKQHQEEMKRLLQEQRATEAKAEEEVRQVRKETGADQITSAAPPAQAPKQELKLEYEKQLHELEKSTGDRRPSYRALKAKFRDLGMDESDMRSPKW